MRYRELQIFSPTFQAIDDFFAGLLLVIGARSNTRLCRWFADLSREPLFSFMLSLSLFSLTFHILFSISLYFQTTYAYPYIFLSYSLKCLSFATAYISLVIETVQDLVQKRPWVVASLQHVACKYIYLDFFLLF